MIDGGAIALISQARKMLESASSLDDILDVRDKAAAASEYFRAAKESQEAVNAAMEIKLRAERKAGELLATMEKHPGGRPSETSNTVLPVLRELGIGKMQSSRWQTLHRIPDEAFEEHISHHKASGREMTTSSFLQLAKRQPVANEAGIVINGTAVVSSLDELSGVFGTIYADPPWAYDNSSSNGAAYNHYFTMPVEQIAKLPVADRAAADCHLHLWATSPLLPEALMVMQSWGFTYRSHFVWCKPQLGMGNSWRISHELLLFGTRGNVKTFAEHNHRSWMEYDRQEHSQKPEEIRSIIERVSPGPYLELFGRRAAQGWTVMGNQVGA